MSHRRSINCPFVIALNTNVTRRHVNVEGKSVLINAEEWVDFTGSGEDGAAADES